MEKTFHRNDLKELDRDTILTLNTAIKILVQNKFHHFEKGKRKLNTTKLSFNG